MEHAAGDYKQGQRYNIPSRFQAFINRFRFSTEELQFMSQNKDVKLISLLQDLTTARDKTNPLVLPYTGRGIVAYGVTTATAYNADTNVGAETVSTGIILGCFFDDDPVGEPKNMKVLKHARGFRGDFRKISLTWPAQNGISARIEIYQFNEAPFAGADSAT